MKTATNNEKKEQARLFYDEPVFKVAIDKRTKQLEREYSKLNKIQLLNVAAKNTALVETLLASTDHMAGTIREQQNFLCLTGKILERLNNEAPLSGEMLIALNEMNNHFLYLAK